MAAPATAAAGNGVSQLFSLNDGLPVSQKITCAAIGVASAYGLYVLSTLMRKEEDQFGMQGYSILKKGFRIAASAAVAGYLTWAMGTEITIQKLQEARFSNGAFDPKVVEGAYWDRHDKEQLDAAKRNHAYEQMKKDWPSGVPDGLAWGTPEGRNEVMASRVVEREPIRNKEILGEVVLGIIATIWVGMAAYRPVRTKLATRKERRESAAFRERMRSAGVQTDW